MSRGKNISPWALPVNRRGVRDGASKRRGFGMSLAVAPLPATLHAPSCMNRRLFCALTLVTAAAAGCGGKSKTPHIRVEDFQTYRSGDPLIQVACVGDSITYGAGIPDREKSPSPIRPNCPRCWDPGLTSAISATAAPR